MHSPPQLYGSSKTTGGILHGHALGNSLNAADLEDIPHHTLHPIPGKVLVYFSEADPANLTIQNMKPATFVRHNVTSSIKPILTKVADKFSPIKSNNLLVLVIEFILTSCH
jgi:hypothetical protein